MIVHPNFFMKVQRSLVNNAGLIGTLCGRCPRGGRSTATQFSAATNGWGAVGPLLPEAAARSTPGRARGGPLNPLRDFLITLRWPDAALVGVDRAQQPPLVTFSGSCLATQDCTALPTCGGIGGLPGLVASGWQASRIHCEVATRVGGLHAGSCPYASGPKPPSAAPNDRVLPRAGHHLASAPQAARTAPGQWMKRGSDRNGTGAGVSRCCVTARI